MMGEQEEWKTSWIYTIKPNNISFRRVANQRLSRFWFVIKYQNYINFVYVAITATSTIEPPSSSNFPANFKMRNSWFTFLLRFRSWLFHICVTGDLLFEFLSKFLEKESGRKICREIILYWFVFSFFFSSCRVLIFDVFVLCTIQGCLWSSPIAPSFIIFISFWCVLIFQTFFHFHKINLASIWR